MFPIVHSADLHLGRNFLNQRYDYEMSQKRKESLWNTFENILSFSKNNHATLLLCGDTFDHTPEVHEVIHFLNCTGKYPEVPVYIIEGNHDQGFVNKLEQLKGSQTQIHTFQTAELSFYEIDEIKVRIYGIKWNSNVVLSDELKKNVLDSSYTNILMLHSSLEEKKDAYMPIHKKELLNYGYDYYALGHVHQPITLYENMIFSGSPEPLSFRETGKHGIILGVIKKNKNKLDFIQMSKVEYVQKIIELSENMQIDQLDSIIEKEINNYSKNHYLRIIFRGMVEKVLYDYIEKFQMNSHYKYAYLEFINNCQIAFDYDLLKKLHENDIVGQFIKTVERESFINREEILALGLEALLREKI